MRCKKHPYEGGGGGGVCASCLRDRLVKLAAAQNEASSVPPTPPPPPEPAAAAFPRSVSPYVCRRRSDVSGASRHHGSLLFFRTPQVGPASGTGAIEEGDIGFEKRRSGKFSVLAALFGHHHRSEEKGGDKERKHRSWLTGFMPRGRRRKKEAATASCPSPPRRSSRVISNRGLSPERSGGGSGEDSSSPAEQPWRPSPSPMRNPQSRRRNSGAVAGVSGFAVCLSPLVRPSPGRHHRGSHPPDVAAFSGELRPSPLHSLSFGPSFTHCRSRKLADGGRLR